MVITFDNVSFKYIEKKLLDGASFSLTDSDKVGIVGVNGTGKTTLLKLICGLEKPNKGNIIISGGMQINYLEQEPHFLPTKTALEVVLEAGTKEHPVLDYEARAIITKLKLDPEAKIAKFSGGELKRLALAKVLVTYSDMLILDEPTNHLDNEMIIWLEKYLLKWKKGLIMVTHDRYFLERVCNRMLELDYGKTYLYEANYTKFLELKVLRLENESKQKQKLKSILRVEKEWMSRSVEARRTKSKSRIERFNKLSEIEFNQERKMEFTSLNTRLGKKLIEIEHGTKAFGDKVLFKDFNWKLERSDVIGFVGENGAGKSTLFKIIMGLEKLDAGELILGETLRIGYFAQHLDLIDPEIRVIDYIKEKQGLIETLDGVITASELLENFLFDGELQYTKVKMLSGGEKRRLQLVRVLMSNPNLLILDEPTNDLDIYTLEILENYLESFRGPVLVVSHDRYFLDKVCNKLFVFEQGSIKEYMLSFSEYLKQEPELEVQVKKASSGKKNNQNKMSSKDRNELASLEKEVPELETKLGALQKELSTLTTEYTKIMELQAEIDSLEVELDTKLNRLFELEELKASLN